MCPYPVPWSFCHGADVRVFHGLSVAAQAMRAANGPAGSLALRAWQGHGRAWWGLCGCLDMSTVPWPLVFASIAEMEAATWHPETKCIRRFSSR